LHVPIRIFLLAVVLLAPAAFLQAPTPYNTTEINPDKSITFRYRDPNATSVALRMEMSMEPVPMKKDAAGIWSVTTAPMPPQILNYNYIVNGRTHYDPRNYLHIVPNYFWNDEQLEVPGDGPQLWDIQDVPHGELHIHHFTSKVVQGLRANQDDYFVYTPPGYDPRSKTRYPVLYLLHGWSNKANQWSEGLQANYILDNLLAQHKILPMVVVMPLSYGDIGFVVDGSIKVWTDRARVSRNTNLFSEALLTEIIPRIESEYNVSANRESRAIAGLSMGGLESLVIGLNHTQQFAWVGGFSATLGAIDPAKEFPVVTSAAETTKMRLIWIACGKSDGLLGPNRKLIAHLKQEGYSVTGVETPGGHAGFVWRQNLIQFAPLLFR
jgi:enterochelin esterase-like enzyme